MSSALAAAAGINDGDCTSTGGDLFVLELEGAVEIRVGLRFGVALGFGCVSGGEAKIFEVVFD